MGEYEIGSTYDCGNTEGGPRVDAIYRGIGDPEKNGVECHMFELTNEPQSYWAYPLEKRHFIDSKLSAHCFFNYRTPKDSYWTFYEDDKELFKATFDDMWAEEGNEDIYGETATKAYAIEVIERLRKVGLDRVKYLLTGKISKFAPHPSGLKFGGELYGQVYYSEEIDK